jgi:hypothetical protein
MRDDDIDDRRDDPFFTAGVVAAMVMAVVLAASLFVWAPWSGSKVAINSAPGVTTGQSSSAPRPATPAAPAPAPVKQ